MSLNLLISELTTLESRGEIQEFCQHLDVLSTIDINDCLNWVSYDQYRYQKKCLYRTEAFEIILICWSPGQETPQHFHPKHGCLMKVLKGQLKEVRQSVDGDITTLLQPGDISRITDEESHIISNLGEHSVSLHVYAPSKYYQDEY